MDERTWDCHVLSIGRKYFWARTNYSAIDAYDVRLPIAKVTQRDQSVFQVGALFDMRIRGSRYSLKFSHRRYTKAELAEADKRARRMAKYFAVSASPSQT